MASWVHYLLEEDSEPEFLQPLRKEILTSNGKLIDIRSKDKIVQRYHGFSIGSYPLIRDNVYQKPSSFTGNWIILDDLYSQGSFIIDSN